MAAAIMAAETTNTTEDILTEEFEYVDLHTIDPTFKPVDAGVYTLQINKLTSKVIDIKNGKNTGKSATVINGGYTIVGDPNFSGRKLWHSFWSTNRMSLVELRKQMDATGVEQQQGETLSDYANRLGELNPPAEFKCYVAVEPDYRDAKEMVNVIKFRQAQSC